MATRIYKTPFAATGDKEALAAEDQPDGKVSLQAGWTPDYELPDDNANYRPVGRAEMNGIIGEITEGLGEMQLNGFAKWQTVDGGWPMGAYVNHGGGIFRSTASNNTSTPAPGDGSWAVAFPLIFSITALPMQDIGPVIVAECAEVWTWSESQYFTGYRSPLCGRPLDGHTLTPLVSEVDATGGLLSKMSYARLWGYAQEQGLVKTEAEWLANRGAHWFTDYSSTQFRVPDLRDMFRRFSGTDADTANARAIGSRQNEAINEASLTLLVERDAYGVTSGNGRTVYQSSSAALQATGVIKANGGKETRPKNTAFHPRIHA